MPPVLSAWISTKSPPNIFPLMWRSIAAILPTKSNVASDRVECRTVGALDILVNNAAIQPQESYVPLHELPAEVWHRLVAVNFSGYTFLAKYALQQMRQQQSGVVVNIASGQGHRTAREVGAYGPIKAGNIMQARQWAIEYARDGIRVVSVSPGAIDTPLVRASLSKQGGAAVIANRHPVGRLGTPEEVATPCFGWRVRTPRSSPARTWKSTALGRVRRIRQSVSDAGTVGHARRA